MPKRFLVIGLGRFGISLAETLTAQGCEVVAADMNMQNVEAVKDRVAYAVQLDASDPEALRSVHAPACASAIVAIGEMFEATVLCVAALREVGVANIVARARTTMQTRILTAVGATHVIEIETEMGRRLGVSLATASDITGPLAVGTLAAKQVG